MSFLKMCGLLDDTFDPDKVSKEIITMILSEATNFVQCGVNHTGSEYEALTPIERACLKIAREKDRAEFAAMIGKACLSAVDMAEVLEASDGGELKRNMILHIAATSAAEGMQSRVFDKKWKNK